MMTTAILLALVCVSWAWTGAAMNGTSDGPVLAGLIVAGLSTVGLVGLLFTPVAAAVVGALFVLTVFCVLGSM